MVHGRRRLLNPIVVFVGLVFSGSIWGRVLISDWRSGRGITGVSRAVRREAVAGSDPAGDRERQVVAGIRLDLLARSQ